jgi:ABC-2 type transport system permease protein
MNKMFAVLKREYLQAVRKKSFIIITLTMPILMAGLMFIPSLIAMKGLGERNVVVVDGTGRLQEAVEQPDAAAPGRQKGDAQSDLEKLAERSQSRTPMGNIHTRYVSAEGADPREAAQPYLDRMSEKAKEDPIDGVLVVPSTVFESSEATITYFSRSSTDLMAQERLGRRINDEIQRSRLTERGIDESEIGTILRRVRVDAVQLTRAGEEKRGGELNFLIGFLFVILLMMPSLIYGTEVMRGIVQEKTDRVVEVLVSSLTPMQLLSGKILGLALVGLTQLAVWLVMGGALGAYWAGIAAVATDVNIFQFLRPAVFVYFVVFFLLAYLIYVSFYAIAGAVCNSEKEAQQFVTPVMLVLMIPWFLMMPIIMNPDSSLSVGLSLIPFFAPITMFVRLLVSEVAFWQVLTAIGLSIGTIWVLFWITAKIFRVGILSYGKRPTIPELWKWMKVA